MTTYGEIAVEKAGEWFVGKMENAGINDLKTRTANTYHEVAAKAKEGWDETNKWVIDKSGGRLDGKTAAIGAGVVVVGGLAVAAIAAPESAVGAAVITGVEALANVATKIPEASKVAYNAVKVAGEAIYLNSAEVVPQIAEAANTVTPETPLKVVNIAAKPIINYAKEYALEYAESQLGKEAVEKTILYGKVAVASIGATAVSNELTQKATDIARHPYEHLVEAKHSLEGALGKQDADALVAKAEKTVEWGFGDKGVKFVNRLNKTEQEMEAKDSATQVAGSAIAPVPSVTENKPNFFNGGNKEGFQRAMEANRPNTQIDQANSHSM